MPTADGAVRAWHDLGQGLPRAYEWFYFDLLEHDGTQMSVSLLAPNPFDLSPYLELPGMARCQKCAPPNIPAPARHAGVAVHVSVPKSSVAESRSLSVQQYFHLDDGDQRVAFTNDPWLLNVGGASVRRGSATPTALPTYSLQFQVTDGASTAGGELTFQAVQPEWMVPDDGLLFEQQTDIAHWHRWAVHVPRAMVNGSVEISAPKEASIKRDLVDADGYHDHNWGTRRPADAFQRWMWARGSAGDNAVVAATLVPNPTAGYTDLRISSLFAVHGSKGVSANLFSLVPGSASGGLSFAKTIDVGPSPSGSAYRAVFEHDRIALDVPTFYQRRIAKLELYDPAGGAPVNGWAVAETMLPQNVG